MVLATAPLIGFSGEIIWPLRELSLLVKIGDEEHSTSAWMNFVVVRSSSPYNIIIRRPGVRKIQAVPSTAHGMLKFPVAGGVLTLRSSKIIPIECAVVSGLEGKPPASHQAIEERIKHDDSWRMCVDFKDLNKACPKDGYSLPEIDWKVESLCGFPFKCSLDAYKSYHQIKMAKEDEEKTTVIISQGVFFYSKMPFGLRHAGATYQRLVDRAFHKQIGMNLKDVQKLNGKLASLNRFLAKSAEKSLPFFKTLKKCIKKGDFRWTEEADDAFKQMKQLIAELPTLTAPEEKEELIIYLATAKEAVSVVLMTEREAKQMLIYFVSRALRGPEVNYTSMEKLVLALVYVSKHLKRYFQAHPIIVVTDQPIKQVLSKPKVAGRLQKWSIELGEYSIHYRPRVSVKGQILADFIVERPEEDDPDTAMEVEDELPERWILFTDGSSCTDGSGAGLILTNPEGAEFTYALRFRMFLIKQVPRSENKKADALSKIASTSFAHLSKQVLVEELKEKSINELEVLAVVEEEGSTWMTLIYEYLTKETLPAEMDKARAMRRKSQRFTVINGVLYKKSFLGPWIRCVRPLQANYVLREIHEGSCSMHAGTRSVVAKALRTGYY
ncbi:reverse transcriptase domain-containing protein [Tanacetum coccineum]